MKDYNPYLFRACYGGLSNIKDASELFWILISDLVEQSEMPHKQKEECFAFFWNEIGEDGPAFFDVENNDWSIRCGGNGCWPGGTGEVCSGR